MESRIYLHEVRNCLKYKSALYKLKGLYAANPEHIPKLSAACDIGITLGVRSANQCGAIGRTGGAA